MNNTNSSYFDNKPSFVEPQVTQYGSHMVMTQVMKELKTKYISLDTKFADPYYDLSVAQCSFGLPERITGVQSISVASVFLPISFFNISAALQNNTFLLDFGTSSLSIQIPDGNYTLTNLAIAINLLLPSEMTFALTTDPLLGFCYFTFTASSTKKSLQIRFNTDETGKPNKWDFKSRLGWILGFRQPLYTFSSSYPSNAVVSTLKSEGMVNLNTVKYVFLVLDEYSSSSHSSSFHSFLPESILNKNILAQIAIDSHAGWGGFQNATLHNGLLVSDTRQFQGDRVDFQKCQVQLVNEFGRVLALNQNDFSFVLELKHS